MEVFIKFDTDLLPLFASLGERQRADLLWRYFAFVMNLDQPKKFVPQRLQAGWLQLQAYAVSAAPAAAPAAAVRNASAAVGRFQAPTLEEVSAYAKRKGYEMDVERFYAYYSANGWKVGRNPMKSWHYALAYWYKNEQRFINSGTGTDRRGSGTDRRAAAEEYFSDYLQRSSKE